MIVALATGRAANRCRWMGTEARDGLAWDKLFQGLDKPDSALQTWIRQALVAAVETRTLSAGTRLPSSRRLAEILDVARNTVVSAYEELVDEGYLVSHQRSGFFVAADGHTAERRPTAPASHTADSDAWRQRFAVQPSLMQHIHKPRDWQSYPYPFLSGQLDPAMFPTASWRESVTAASSVSNINDWASDRIDEDDEALLEQLRSQVLPRRAIWAAQDEAMITIGAQQALSLVTQLLVRNGTPVSVENPGYPDTRNMVTLAGGVVHPMAVDGDGAIVDHELRRSRVIFLTPGHQCPTTAVMPLERRQALLDVAAAHDVTIIEDDYDADLAPDGFAVPPLKSLDRDGRVIYVGSLSKVLAPGLRLGFIVAPAPVIRELRVLRRLILRHPPSNNQRAMAMFIALGHYRGHLKRTAQILDERALLLDSALPSALPNFYWQRGTGSPSYWVTGPRGFDARRAVDLARGAGILIEPGDVFFANPEDGSRCFRIGFSAIRTERIIEGISRLGRLIA